MTNEADYLEQLTPDSAAPRPMKMGTILSPWRYDVAA